MWPAAFWPPVLRHVAVRDDEAAPTRQEPQRRDAIRQAIGDLTGDLSSKRGHVTGTQPRPAATAAIHGQIPLAELDDYQGRLKSLTAGKGSYSIAFSHYAQVPAQTQSQLMAAHKTVSLDEE